MNNFHQFKLSNTAIQTISRIQVALRRFPVVERQSILKYLLAAETTQVNTGLFAVPGTVKKRWSSGKTARAA